MDTTRKPTAAQVSVSTPGDFLSWLETFEAHWPEIKIRRPGPDSPSWEAAGIGFELTLYPTSADLWADLASRFPLED